jgi:protease I
MNDMNQLTSLQVAAIATDGVEVSELTQPVAALTDAGAKVAILSTKPGAIQTFKHLDKNIKVDVDLELSETLPGAYDALLLPGGALNADTLRANPAVLAFIRAFQESGKPIAAICHAPWELISAGLVRGRKLTSYHTIQDDVRNAGGEWIDREVVVNRNWVTSRQPSDIPAFVREMKTLFSAILAPTDIAR